MYHWLRWSDDLCVIKDTHGETIAYTLGEQCVPHAQRIMKALILSDIIDQRTEVFRSIAEKWQDGSKL